MRALNESKRSMFGKTSEMTAGEQADLRLDIPAYKDHGVWVNSIHRKDQPTVYGSTSSVKNATMIGSPDKALKVAQGGPKAPFAVIRGEWNPMDEAMAVKNAQDYLNNPDWKQVGYDPERHGFFYDRLTMAPIIGADEVIQIGPLVLAKKPKYGNPDDFPFKKGGSVRKGGGGFMAKQLAKRLAPEVLPIAKREANLVKFLEPSVEKRRMYHGSKNPDIKHFQTRKDMTDESMMTGHYADERDAVFLSPDPDFTKNFSIMGYTDEGMAPTTYPVHVQRTIRSFQPAYHIQKIRGAAATNSMERS
jgi:hypothetical protein